MKAEDITVNRGPIRTGSLAAEGFEFVHDPEALLADAAATGRSMDLFTFIQRLPATTPAYEYPMEWDNVAAMPISTFEHWWTRQINAKTRNMVRRAEKKGLVVRQVPFDDVLVRGIWDVYNENPVRQGKLFPHYGKDIEAVRQMSATFLDSSVFVGAYFREKLVGFAKLTVDEARSQAALMHILSLIEHKDKAPTNALIAGSVKACEKLAVPFLVYSKYSYWKKRRDSLSDFKEHNGFRRFDVPRYYVPLTRRGAAALRLGLHHGVLGFVPEPAVAALRRLRDAYYTRKFATTARVSLAPWFIAALAPFSCIEWIELSQWMLAGAERCEEQ